MAQRTIAIDISPTAVRLVQLEATFRKAQVTMVTTVPIPEGTDRAGMWQLVRDYVPQNIDNIVVSGDGRAASTRALSFPFVDPKKVDAAVEFELENLVPYAMENTGLTWHTRATENNKTDVVAALAAKDTVRALIGEMGVVGLEPRAVVLPAAALAELVPPSEETIARHLDRRRYDQSPRHRSQGPAVCTHLTRRFERRRRSTQLPALVREIGIDAAPGSACDRSTDAHADYRGRFANRRPDRTVDCQAGGDGRPARHR